jgi:hypothetical protein
MAYSFIMDLERITNAANGKTASKGGLNLTEISAILRAHGKSEDGNGSQLRMALRELLESGAFASTSSASASASASMSSASMSSASKPELEVIWNDDKTVGWEITRYGKSRVTNWSTGARSFLAFCLRIYIANIHKLREGNIPYVSDHILLEIRPALRAISMSARSLKNAAKRFLLEDAQILKTDTDADFLLRARNYTEICPICLAENIEDAILFRPCGHAICDDCFGKLATSHGHSLKNMTYRAGNLTLMSRSYDPSKVIGLKCPTCRATIEKAIRPSDIDIPSEWIEACMSMI